MTAISRRKGDAGDQKRAALSGRFTLRYAIALVLMAAVVIVAGLRIFASTERVRDSGLLLARAADQTALVYQIQDTVSKIDRDFSNPETTRTHLGTLDQDLTTISQVHAGMKNGDATLKVPTRPTISPELNEIYGNSTDGLDRTISQLTDQARRLETTALGSLGSKPGDWASLSSAVNDSADTVIQGYTKLSRQLEKELDKAVSDQRDAATLMLVVFAVTALGVGLGLFRPMARNIAIETGQLEEAEKNHRLNNERQTFRNTLKETLESADTEEEVLATLGRAVRSVVPDLRAEILLVNATESRLVRGADISDHGSPSCPVESPMGCAAFRRSQTEVFESSRMLNACPKLAARGEGALSAVCVPLKFRGRALGVLHTVAPDGHPPTHTQIERLTTVAAETGVQLGTVRATQSDRLQATTDGLTGLLNRRSLETAAKGLMSENRTFSVAIADLDHFKDLNDTYGHEAGDTALKLFAKVLKANLRPDDVAARYGGEEFVLVLPGTNIREAQAALERLQLSLAAEIERVKGIPFTASWGLTDQSAGSTFDEMIGVADAALYSAKRAGRNCIYVDGEAASAYQELAPEQIWDDGAGDPGAGPPADDAPLIQIDHDLLPPSITSRKPTTS